MGLFDKQRKCYEAARAHLAGLCRQDDPLVGAFIGAQAKVFGNTLFAVGVTQFGLVVQRLTKSQQPDGPPKWYQISDIENCALWGRGGGFSEWFAENSEFELRFKTRDGEHYKILALGGWTMSKAMGPEYIEGLHAVAEWLGRTRP